MKIGVFGSGKVGAALGAWAARVGHTVAFSSRALEHADKAAIAAGAEAQSLQLSDLFAFADIVLLTFPDGEIADALKPVRTQLAGKILVDVTNPITPDHRDLTINHRDSGAETIARDNPAALLVKAFNATFAEVYQSQDPKRDGHRISIAFCGDDSESKARVRKLIEDFGFDAVDAGPLKNSRYLEPLSLLNIHLGRELGYGTSIGCSLLRSHL